MSIVRDYKNKAVASPFDFKSSLRRVTGVYQNLIAISLFTLGIALRIISINQTGALWPIVGEIGTFLAAVIAIPFIYEKLVKTEDRQIFLSDLEDALEKKLAVLGNVPTKPFYIYEEGRLEISQKVAFFKDAEQEIIEIATAARSFVSYFESRPYYEFKKPVEEALRRGVNFSIFVFDPDCPNAPIYSADINDEDVIQKIRRSLEGLISLRNEFRTASYSGKFEVFVYSQLPLCYLLSVDPQNQKGRLHISHYLNGLKRADTPVIEVHRSANPMLFDKYMGYVKRLASASKEIK